MANTKITELTELSAAPASADVFCLVDVSDVTMGASGTTKKIQVTNFTPTLGSTALTLGSAVTTVTGMESLTVTSGAGAVIATSFTGALVGDVTGNVTGNLTGNVTGDLTGDVTGDVTGSSGSCTGNAATVTNGVYTTNNLSALAATTSAQLAGVISDETGSGALVFATSPTLVTPALGTPASGVLTNCTGYTGDSSLVTVGTIASGTWNGTAIDGAYVDIEGTEVKSTGETGGTKFLREDGDGTCSWVAVSGSGTVTSVATSGTVNGLTLTGGTITETGTITLGGTLSVDLTADVTGTLPAANGGTGLTAISTLLNSNTTKSDVGLSAVENTALSTWAGTSNVTTLGTVTTGTWTGTAVVDGYIASAATWNAKAAAGANGDITSMTGLDADGIPLAKVANAASDGANSDITSLTGLTTALTVAQGGTGATSLTDKAVLISQDTGTDAIGAVALTSNGQIIVGGADGPAAATITAGTNVSVTNAANSITIASTDEFTGTVTSVGGGTGLSGTVTSSGSLDLDLNSLSDITAGGDVSGWNAGDTIAIVDSADGNNPARIKLPAEICIACSDETTVIDSTGVKTTFMVPRAMTVTEVKLSLTTADSSGLTLNLDDRADDPSSSGTDMLYTDLDSSSDYTASTTVFDGSAGSYDLDEDDFVAVNVTYEGASEAAGLKVWLLGFWT